MDIFAEFMNWIAVKEKEWELVNIVVENIKQSNYAHQIHVNLHSEEGVGHIGLFESNEIYWIEFEAAAREFESFYRYLEINSFPNLDNIEKEYLQFLNKN